MYSELKKKGIKQIVFCPKDSELSLKIEPGDLRTYRKRGGVDIAAGRKLSRICDENLVDILHAHDAHAHTTCVLAADFFGNKPPIVLSRRVDFAVGSSWFSRYKYNHPKICSIVCVSDAINRIVRDGIKNAGERNVVTVHSGTDSSRFQHLRSGRLRNELGIPEHTILVGNASALADHKDYPTFLHVAARFKEKQQFHFVIIGTGSLEEELKKLATELGLTQSLTFTGYRNDLPEILPDLDIFLFTSKTEGLGTTVLDAIASGIPVVATSAGGVPEMIINEETGLLCDVGDVDSLAQNLIRLSSDEDLKSRLIKGAKDILPDFSVESMVNGNLEVYRNCLEKSE
ncbi:MAG: glycosyltransferase [Bacteroidetes bacterium]|nr:glycosyltransferase [Bacteroidota bacterium]